jgi:hypothetical protein
MSRSRKIPWIKDRTSLEYNRIIRHKTNQLVKRMLIDEDLELPSPRTIINDYNICDWVWYLDKPKYRRK